MMKIFIAVFWIVILLGLTGQYVDFPNVEIEKTFVWVFIIGCSLITVFVKFPEERGIEG